MAPFHQYERENGPSGMGLVCISLLAKWMDVFEKAELSIRWAQRLYVISWQISQVKFLGPAASSLRQPLYRAQSLPHYDNPPQL